jgi:hypothetical protein
VSDGAVVCYAKPGLVLCVGGLVVGVMVSCLDKSDEGK